MASDLAGDLGNETLALGALGRFFEQAGIFSRECNTICNCPDEILLILIPFIPAGGMDKEITYDPCHDF